MLFKGVFKGGGFKPAPPPPEIFRFLFEKCRKRGRKKNERDGGGGCKLLTYFLGLRYFQGGMRNFRGGGLRNFSGVEIFFGRGLRFFREGLRFFREGLKLFRRD